jgi:SAM-dependent methyltransferase
MINNRLAVKPTKMVDKHWAHSLFDAEVISHKNNKIILLFDAYFVNSNNISSNLLEYHPNASSKPVQSRLSYAREFAKDLTNQSGRFVIDVKKFLVAKDPSEWYNACRELLIEQKNSMVALQYETDGIIFTPQFHPVGANTQNGTANFVGTWDRVLKWKPANQNTIDFLVRIRQDPITQKDVIVNKPGGQGKILMLYVAGRIRKTSAYEFLRSGGRPSKGYDAEMLFMPESEFNDVDKCFVATSPSDGTLRCENGDTISTECVVEMAWSIEKSGWLPLRVRFDKTELYKNTRVISNTANSMGVALSIWRTIIHPIEETHLLGTKQVSIEDVPMGDIKYYDRKTKRDESALFRMNEFHNKWVKAKHLLNRFIAPGASLMDIGCGKGGDMNKWLLAGCTTVLGIDLYKDNITNPYDGAYARLMETRLYDSTKHNYVFLQMDASKKLTPQYFDTIENENDKYISNILWGVKQTRHVNLTKYYKLASSGFNVVSCQFAMHYFFASNDALDSFCFNIATHLKRGGVFVGTCFDGSAVNNLLDKNSIVKDEVYQVRDEHGSLIWGIRKLYDNYTSGSTGQAVGVYIQTINQYMTEYLVDYNLLVSALAKYGIRPLNAKELAHYELTTSTGLFMDIFNDMQQYYKELSSDNKDYSWISRALMMTDTEIQLSALNRWCVFIKG